MKKWAVLFAATLLFCFSISFVYAGTLGDIDKDGKISASDARRALRAAVGLDQLSEEETRVADADHSGDISAADARLILRVAVELEAFQHPAMGAWTPAGDGTHVKTCTVCGEVLETQNCRYSGKVILTENSEPTCTDAVFYQQTCSVCGHKKTTEIPALGHAMILDEENSTYSLAGENHLVMKCDRCGLIQSYEHVLTSAPTEENLVIVNHFINRIKGELKENGIKYAATESAVMTGELLNSRYEMNDLMKSRITAINAMLEDDEKIPENKAEFDAILNDMMVGINETQNITIWPVYVTDDNFVLKKQPIVSALLASDLSALTVSTVEEYDIEGFLPDILPETRTMIVNNDGNFWYAGSPTDYNLKTMFLARLQDCANIIKITMTLDFKDETFDSIDGFIEKSNVKRVIDLNANAFKVDDYFQRFESFDWFFEKVQSIIAKPQGTVTYYFDAATGNPLAATYDTEIDTINTVTHYDTYPYNNKIKTIYFEATMSVDVHTKTIYIFDSKLVY